MTKIKQDKEIAYHDYLFGKDFPIDEETDLSPDGQRRLIGAIDQICIDQGGVFLGYVIDQVLSPESVDGIKCRYESAHLVGTNYVKSRIILDGSGNSPKRHSMNTSVNCVAGTENEALLKKINDLYGDRTGMTPYTETKAIS